MAEEKSEAYLTKEEKEGLRKAWSVVDENHDNKLDLKELKVLLKVRPSVDT